MRPLSGSAASGGPIEQRCSIDAFRKNTREIAVKQLTTGVVTAHTQVPLIATIATRSSFLSLPLLDQCNFSFEYFFHQSNRVRLMLAAKM